MNRQRLSLRGRLLLAGMLGVLLVSAVAIWLLGAMFERAARNVLDRHLDNDLITLLALVETDEHGELHMSREFADERYSRAFSGAYWQMLDPAGTSLMQSRSLWDESLLSADQVEPGAARSFNSTGPMGQLLRVRAQWVQLPRRARAVLLAVAADRSHIGEEAAYFRGWTAAALGVLTALWFAVLAYQVGYGLRPLARLGDIAARVRRGEAARFPQADLPTEVAPLAGHLNELLDHHARMVKRARSSAQDLAHALKTPLAVLSAESERPGAQWRLTVDEQVRRMRSSIERYLASGVTDLSQRTSVAEVAMSLCALMRRAHAEKQVAFDCSDCANAVFAGAREDLEEMLGNLLDNAGKWARGQVRVGAGIDDGRLWIEVADDGPGLPDAALENVVKRGIRLDQRQSSSGLGLAIVEDIAASYDGSLTLENREPGLRARLEFPAAGR